MFSFFSQNLTLLLQDSTIPIGDSIFVAPESGGVNSEINEVRTIFFFCLGTIGNRANCLGTSWDSCTKCWDLEICIQEGPKIVDFDMSNDFYFL
jgi:hypothetical protein